jgi:UDP-N-acetyl-D-glucosamine dehydrogenase
MGIELMQKNLVVIGLGYVGLPLVINAANSGFNVYGFDTSESKIKELKSGNQMIESLNTELLREHYLSKKIRFTSNIEDVPGDSIFVIAVPTPLDNLGKPDLSYLELACKSISKVISPGSLVISESTSYIGTLRNFIRKNIDELSNVEDIHYGVAPERIDPGNETWNLKNTPRIISGLTDVAIEGTLNFYKNFCTEVIVVTSPEVAEASKLLENTFRLVNIALINEFSNLTRKLGLNTFEITSAAATKPFGFMQFLPGIGVGGHCIPIDPIYLMHSAREVEIDLEMVGLANDINLSAHKSVINKLENLLGSDLKGKKIQIVGISYKINIADTRESPVPKFISELEFRGATVTWHDPLVKKFNGQLSTPLSLDIDLGLLVNPHDCIDLNIWKQNGVKVFDVSSNKANHGWSKIL